MDPAGGYKNYRTKLREHPVGRPCIPYFALCLRDLTYIRLGEEAEEGVLFCLRDFTHCGEGEGGKRK